MTRYERLQKMSIEEVAWELIELASVALAVGRGAEKDDTIKAIKSLKDSPEAKILIKRGAAELMKEEEQE